MRLLISFLLLVATCSACSLPAQPVEERLDDLGPAIQQLLNDYHAAGLALAVVDKDKVRFARGYGFRDVDQQLPVDEHTVFGIGSITKAFTASILGQLEVQGELDFYDSPQTYLPELSFSTDEMNESIRIHHLLTHSTGLSGFMTESTAILFLTENRQALLQRLQHFPPMAAAGERYDYSNMMYTLVGYIGASITGKSWQENVRTRLFAPLSMQDSYTSARAAQQAANFSLGYAVQDSLYPATVLPEKVPSRAPAGDIYSSVSDMSKWMRMWLNDGQWKGQQILPKSYIKQAWAPHQLMQIDSSNVEAIDTISYGYGWFTRKSNGIRRVEHSGGVSGYASNLVLLPEKELGIIVLTNQTTSNLAYRVTELLTQQLLGIPNELDTVIHYSDKHVVYPNVPTTINEEQPPSLPLASLAGTYSNPAFGTLKIHYDGTTLFADFPLTSFRLEHVAGNVFLDRFAEEIPLLMWNFMRFNFVEEDGKIGGIQLNLNDPPILFTKK